jgi:hypothetical protein
MARPQADIDPEQVYKLAALHCTNKEMADILGISTDTLERRFAAEIVKGKSDAKRDLRDMQWKACKRGNITMMIWLGKQMLGQRDKSDEELKSAAPNIIADKALIQELIKLASSKDAGKTETP